MKYWFTADHHFFHRNIIKFCNRPFSGLEEMHDVMIERWNSVVGKNDIVYHIGDFSLGKYDETLRTIFKLNGTVYFLRGSHDKWLNDYEVDYQDRVWGYMDVIDILGKTFTLCHYAMRTWPHSHYGAYHLYGHSHGNLPSFGYSMDVGVDTNNFYPYSFDDIVERFSKKEVTEYKIYGKHKPKFTLDR